MDYNFNRYAKREIKPLSTLGTVDEVLINTIIPLIPSTYTHPSKHPAEMIVQDTNRNFVTTSEKGNIHAAGSDNQDLSNLVVKVTGHSLVPDTEITKLSGLNKITISGTPPSNPQPNEIWIQTS